MKNLLNAKTVKELRTIGKVLQIPTANLKKAELVGELISTIGSYEITESVTICECHINAIISGEITTFDKFFEVVENISEVANEIRKEINNATVQELCVTSDDFDNQADRRVTDARVKVSEVTDKEVKALFNTSDNARSLIYAKIKGLKEEYKEQKVYDYNHFSVLECAVGFVGNILNEQINPYFFAFRNAMQEKFNDLLLKVEYYDDNTFTVFADEKSYNQDDIANLYNEEQKAMQQLYFNNWKMQQPVSLKQLEIIMNNATKFGDEYLGKRITKLLQNVQGSNMLIAEMIINDIFAQSPPSEKQLALIKKMKAKGIKPNVEIKTSKDASTFIDNNIASYSKLNLKSQLSLHGINVSDEKIASLDDDKVKKYSAKLSNIGAIVGLAFKFTQTNLFDLIEKIAEMNNMELLTLQTACLTQDIEHAKQILKYNI